jgi:excisionase family DNA binding protein
MTMSENATDRIELLTIPEAAARMRVPNSWVYAATKRGRFPCVRFGKYVRIRDTDVEAWIEAGGRGADGDEVE